MDDKEVTNVTVEIIIFCSIVVIGFYVLVTRRKLLKLPPGPAGLPLVGYLPFLDPKAPYETLSSLVDKYGPVYSVRLGTVQAIVVADPVLIKQILNMEETTGRAPLYLTHGIMRGYGLICAEGELWKEHRKFVLSFMRRSGMRKSSGRHQLQEWISHTADQFIENLSCCPTGGIDVNPLLLHYIGNTMNQLIFGISYPEDSKTWMWLRHLLEEGAKLIGITGPLNFLPWLRFIPKFWKIIDFIKKNQFKTHKEYEKIVVEREEHIIDSLRSEESKNAEESLENRERDCLIDAYIRERWKRGDNFGTFHNDQLFHVAADMFGAGSETTVTTLRWHLLDLALHQHVQDRMRDELHSVTKSQTFNVMDNFCQIPYCVSAFMETQRLRNTVPTGIPHGVLKDINVEGFTFPKGSMILPLLWRIHRDPKYWLDPLKFDPDRFLDSEGQILKHVAFMPFQTGRRLCIGEEFAKMVVLTFISKILLKYRITLSTEDGTDDPTKNPVCGITLVPNSHRLVFTPLSSGFNTI